MAKKVYQVNVHYDYCATVTVEAESEDEALDLAKAKADELPSSALEYCDYTDSCVTDVRDPDE